MADFGDAEVPQHSQTYMQTVKQGEQHVLWKLGLRITACVLAIIAIGAAAWSLAHALDFRANPYIGYFEGADIAPWAIGVCGLSFIFCLVCILVLLLRRPPKPAHPGIAVGCDLILWLAFIVTGLFTTVAIFSVANFGRYNDGTLSDPSYPSGYSGEYYLSPTNDTWIYNITSVSSSSSSYGNSGYGDYFYNYTRGDYQLNRTQPSTSSVTRDCSRTGFASCAEQDAYINKLWDERDQRLATEIVSAAAQWLLVLCHFTLFVWACVDCHRYNRTARQTKVNAVANKVIADMQARGLITVNVGAAPEGQPLMAENRSAGSGAFGLNGGGESTSALR